MLNGLERRVARLEQRIAERAEKPRVCNCRVQTRFHGADCLDAVLTGTSRVCPLHGFRELGFFWWTPRWCALNSEDNQFCPCPPHPWRSFVMNGPRTWEAHAAASGAWAELPPVDYPDLQEDRRRGEVLLAQYSEARQRWVEKTGRQLPSQKELIKLEWERARKHVD